METISLAVHIVAGILAILAGYTALFASKGADLHRRSDLTRLERHGRNLMLAGAPPQRCVRSGPGGTTAGSATAVPTDRTWASVQTDRSKSR